MKIILYVKPDDFIKRVIGKSFPVTVAPINDSLLRIEVDNEGYLLSRGENNELQLLFRGYLA